MFPDGEFTGTWTSVNGIYQGFVLTVACEADLDIFKRLPGANPDDPDGDGIEVLAWMDPADLPGNPMVRDELAASLGEVLPLLGCPTEGDESACPCGTPAVYDEMNGWQHADGSVSHDDGESVSDKMAAIAKEAYPDGQSYASHAFRPTGRYPNVCFYCGVGASIPFHDAYRQVAKAGEGKGPKGWPGWKLDLRAAGYWQPHVTATAQESLTRDKLSEIGSAYIAANPGQDGSATGKRERNATALAWLQARGVTVPMGGVAEGITADAAMIGGASAQAAVNGNDTADTGGWEPGDTVTARQVTEALGVAAVLALLPGGDGGGGASDAVAGDMEDGYLNVVSRVLAGWDPEVAAEELTGMLEDAVADGAYAEGLTVTQITTVSGDAAMEYYLANSLSEFQWLVDDSPNVCPVCLANERAGPVPAGTAWPSGARNVPQHPRCRCGIVPAWFLTGG